MTPKLITQEEFAKVLRCTVRTVRRLSAGKRPTIPTVRIGRIVRYHLPTVLAAGVNFATLTEAEKAEPESAGPEPGE